LDDAVRQTEVDSVSREGGIVRRRIWQRHESVHDVGTGDVAAGNLGYEAPVAQGIQVPLDHPVLVPGVFLRELWG
jgi:hypothetical protein